MLKRLTKDERGLSAVLVVVCIVAIFGAAMLSVDAGQLYSARRNMITATDASVLSEAKALATNPQPGATNCTGVWTSILNSNATGTFDTACSLTSLSNDATSGVVMVQGRKTSKSRFGGVLGIGDTGAFSMTAAMWGYTTRPTGLRPIALCTYDPHVEDGLLLHGVTPEQHKAGSPTADYGAPDNSLDYAQSKGQGPANATRGTVHHIDFNSSCNGAPGNFGWIDLNEYGGGHNPSLNCSGSCTNGNSGDIADWLKSGYFSNEVSLNSPTDCDTQASGSQTCNGDTGATNSSQINQAMDYLMNPSNPGGCAMGPASTCKPLSVPIILYDTATGQGSNAYFHIIGVAFIKIWGYNLSNDDRYLDIEFTNGLFQGPCCSRTPGTAGSGGNAPATIGIRICGTDHDPQDPNLVAARCTFS